MIFPESITIDNGFNLPLGNITLINYWHIEVAFIDVVKYCNTIRPILYQFPEQVLTDSKYIYNDTYNGFALVGDISSLDKGNKRVVMHNGDIISYHYLIIVSDHHNDYFDGAEPKKFALGIKALQDTLKVRHNNISTAIKYNSSDSSCHKDFEVSYKNRNKSSHDRDFFQKFHPQVIEESDGIAPSLSKVFLVEV